MLILGIDPGTLTMGYGLIEDQDEELRIVDCGILKTSRHMPIAERLRKLYLGLMELFTRYQTEEVAIEEPFVAQNRRSALAIGRAQAIAILAAANNNVPAYTYAPTRVKQVVADYGNSSKEQVQRMVQIQLRMSQIPQPSDAADALALALCHLRERQLAKLISQGD